MKPERSQVRANSLTPITTEVTPLAAVTGVIILITFLACQGKAYYTGPTLVLAKLYSNSLMVLLNARIRIVGGRGTEHGIHTHISLADTQSRTDDTQCVSTMHFGTVHVKEEYHVHVDEDSSNVQVGLLPLNL